MTFIANKNKRLLEFMSINRGFFYGPSTSSYRAHSAKIKPRFCDRKIFPLYFVVFVEANDMLVIFPNKMGVFYVRFETSTSSA